MHVTESGVRYQDLVVGKGKECKMGSQVECHYTLWFADSTGKKIKRFQSSKDTGRTFRCTLGYRLIKGWSDGMVGMKEGGTRRLIIPPELGYGKGGGPIPPNQWLVFEIDFLKLIK
ncbi:MAG: FKBP-type peptidyl-prolyl cis-trans isomerase [Candidatus Zixiibacteriota bacterium]|nr:MAG: FKBP-type peptidyl-prolyl cis-trans isomerase [candidate division Zixibacteria bacterium]